MARAKRELTATLYCYVTPEVARFAKQEGHKWGSFSSYVNYQIAKLGRFKKSMQVSKDIAERRNEPSIVVPYSRKKKATKKTAPKRKAKRIMKKKSHLRVVKNTPKSESLAA